MDPAVSTEIRTVVIGRRAVGGLPFDINVRHLLSDSMPSSSCSRRVRRVSNLPKRAPVLFNRAHSCLDVKDKHHIALPASNRS